MGLNTKVSWNIPSVCFLEKGIHRLDTLSGCLASQTLIKAWRDKRSLTAMTDWSHVVVVFFPDQGFCQRYGPKSLCRQLKIVLKVMAHFIGLSQVTYCCCSAARYLQYHSQLLWKKISPWDFDWSESRLAQRRNSTSWTNIFHEAIVEFNGRKIFMLFKFHMKTNVQKWNYRILSQLWWQ